MVFSTLMNDVVTLVKADGTRYGNIKATVQAKLILTGDAKLLNRPENLGGRVL